VYAEPAYVVLDSWNRCRLRRHVDDRDGVFVGVQADLPARVAAARAGVVDALGVVGVAVGGEAPGERGGPRRADVDHVQPAAAAVLAARTDDIGEAALLVDRDVLRGGDFAVVRGLAERHRWSGDRAQLGQFEHLHPVVLRLAELPSGKFAANSAWLLCAVMAFNLTRAAGTLAGGRLARATTATVRRTLIAVPARIAPSARRLTLHLPHAWPWQDAWTE
jgi:hypothetical protein